MSEPPADDVEIPPLERVQVAEVRPGDVIVAVLRHDHSLDESDIHYLRNDISRRWPDNEVVVISGFELKVMRPDDTDKPTLHCTGSGQPGHQGRMPGHPRHVPDLREGPRLPPTHKTGCPTTTAAHD